MVDPPPSGDPSRRGRWATLAVGLWTTVAMWAVAYLCLMQPGLLLGEVLFIAMAACLALGGFLGARASGRGVELGIKAGALIALFNLLIVGSLVGAGDLARESEAPDAGGAVLSQIAWWWVPATIVGSVVLAGAGAGLGRRLTPSVPVQRDWYAAFTKAIVGAGLLLLLSGGVVTGWEAGLAVPDWPQSFGHNMLLYPLTLMTSEEAIAAGVHYEHAHRLYGTLVGCAAIALVGTIWVADRRSWLGWMTLLALFLVIVQGYLGGSRVTDTNLGLAVLHGVFGQIVFATFVAIAAFTSPTWKSRARPLDHPSAGVDRMLAVLLMLFVLVQLSLGAGYRHLNAEMDIPEGMKTGLLHGHITIGVILLIFAIFCGVRAWGKYADQRVVRRTGVSMIHAVVLQILLGVAALVAVLTGEPDDPPGAGEVLITTAHQVMGAVVLGVSVLLVVWTRRLLGEKEA